jgi:hypothetical protein
MISLSCFPVVCGFTSAGTTKSLHTMVTLIFYLLFRTFSVYIQSLLRDQKAIIEDVIKDDHGRQN